MNECRTPTTNDEGLVYHSTVDVESVTCTAEYQGLERRVKAFGKVHFLHRGSAAWIAAIC